MPVILTLSSCTLRPWRTDDAEALARHANDARVVRFLRARFPHPYTLADAHAYLAGVADVEPARSLAIEVDGEATGCISIELGTDIQSVSGEIGIWLGAAAWGRGIATEATRAFSAYAARTFALTCVLAHSFGPNVAAQRVLLTAGFDRVGVLPRSIRKDGEVMDRVLFCWNPSS